MLIITPFSVGIKLQKASTKIFKWLCGNGMKTSQKILDVTTKRKLNFNKYLTNLCDKTSKKIQVLARIFPYIPKARELG